MNARIENNHRTCIAAIVRKQGGPFELEDIRLDPPGYNEVVVRIVASGLCHTDLMVRDHRPESLPVVLGHEGAGIVEETGPGITDLKAGDQVLMSYPSCGLCPQCNNGHPAYCDNIAELKFRCSRQDGTVGSHDMQNREVHDHFFGQSSFSGYSIVNRRNIVKVDLGNKLSLMAPLGCGVQTGAGAIINSLKVPVGASVAIFGAGGVGLSAVMAAKICGASKIIVSDTVDSRLSLALELGATHVLNPTEVNTIDTVRKFTHGRGAQFALDSTGHPAVFSDAVECLCPMGSLGFVGAAPRGVHGNINLLESMTKGIKIQGILQGDSIPSRFIPDLIKYYEKGLLPLEKIVKFYDFSDINQAASDCISGLTIKPILLI